MRMLKKNLKKVKRKEKNSCKLFGRKEDFPVDPFPAAATLTYFTLECWRGLLWKDIASPKCSAVLLQKEMLGSHCPHPLSPEFHPPPLEGVSDFFPPWQWARRKFSPLHPWMFKFSVTDFRKIEMPWKHSIGLFSAEISHRFRAPWKNPHLKKKVRDPNEF